MSAAIIPAYLGMLFIGLTLFALLPARRAMLLVLIGGWLAMPVTDVLPAGIFGPTKVLAIDVILLAGTFLFARGELARLKFSWFDVVVLAWILVAPATEVSNRLGWSAAGGALLSQTVIWGIPYFIGRVYLADIESFDEMAKVLIWGAVALIPLALYDTFCRPPVHQLLWGRPVWTNDPLSPLFLNRWGPKSFRPAGALHEGPLAVSFYFAAAAILITGRTWVGRRSLSPWKWLDWGLVVALIVMPVICKPFVGIILLFFGLCVLVISAAIRTRILMLLTLLIPIAYMTMRTGKIVESP